MAGQAPMSVHVLEREQVVDQPLERVFAFYADPANLQSLTPPWLRFTIITSGPIEMRAGALIAYRLRVHGVPVRWLTRIEEWTPGERFVDIQLWGPYRLWHHTHTFERHGEGTLIRDRVRYALPLGPIGDLVHRAFVRRDLERVFAFRRDMVAHTFR